jgi:hypothetical protein
MDEKELYLSSRKNRHITIDTTAYPPSSETQGIIIRYVELD